MKTLKAIAVLSVLSVAGFTATGCTAAQKGAAGGGLIGGVVGNIVGNNYASTIGPATGTAMGVGAGAAVGGLAGDAYATVTDKDKERELQNLRAELEAKENELASLRQSGLSGDALAELDQLRYELETAQAELENASLTRSGALIEAQEKAERVNRLEETLAKAEQERIALEDTVAMMNEETERLRAEVEMRETALAQAKDEVQVLRTSLVGKETAVAELTRELNDINVTLEETSRGLTMTIVDSMLFDPGEADLTAEGRALMGDVAKILHERFPNRELLIEGHTDNQPIVRSGWRSNWELGAARALNMLHELVGNHGIKPSNVSATSYGEFRPASSNASPDGRRANRRAVIVILPEKLPLEVNELADAR
ncbi:MAG: OmpA family protein [Candidatus Sumerlaeia bacterium]|nr:OmpA family protein [Candidatus Sumerlaeia bacterium]